jgi:septum formation protein
MSQPPTVSVAARHAPLILASASPRRQEILRLAGLPFEVRVSEAEPPVGRHASPLEHAVYGASLKAVDIATQCPDRIVVAADTVVAVGRKILGKPADAAQASAMLRMLSGRRHRVLTGVVLATWPGDTLLDGMFASSQVTFRHLSEAEIDAYVRTGDPLDKAGAYGIQSGGGDLVVEVIGSYLNVVGLPLSDLLTALSALGWAADGCSQA